MTMQRLLAAIAVTVIISFVVMSCSDMGDELTSALLTANPSQVTVGLGEGANVLIGDGTPPYVIAEAPNAAYASAVFVDANANPATLVITGVSIASVSGSTRVKVKDSSPSPEREVSVNITKIP